MSAGEPLAVAVSGRIASGKSTIARRVAEQIDAVLLVADRIREGAVAHLSRERSLLEARLRALESSADDAVYAELLRRAGEELGAGRSVVLDAAFPRRTQRDQARRLAARHAARFRLVECRAGAGAVRQRLVARAMAEGVAPETWLVGLEAGAQRELGSELTSALAEASLESEIAVLEGSRETLEWLAAAGLRRALVCDTGFSPGRVVRQLLDRTGLLDLLEVQAFSDEVGVPKPDARIFEHALGALETPPAAALHVGDLRRTDVAGARSLGMRTVRIRDHFDDPSGHVDADLVADSHAHLRELLAAMPRSPRA